MFKSQNCCPHFHQLYYLINMLITKSEQLTICWVLLHSVLMKSLSNEATYICKIKKTKQK